MEKPLLDTMNYKSISAMESRLLEDISKSGLLVFGNSEPARLSGFSKNSANNLLASLARKRVLAKISRNKYCIAKTAAENRFGIAASAFNPSYVSFWTALSFYGFTEQQVKTIQIASAKQFKKAEAANFTIQPVKVKQENFYGYGMHAGFPIALKEKAIIDSALFMHYSGGFQEFAKCFKKAWPELNKKRFFTLLLKTDNKSLNSRIGYLIDALKLNAEKKYLKILKKKRSKGFVKLNPFAGKTKKYSKAWMIIINDSLKPSGVL